MSSCIQGKKKRQHTEMGFRRKKRESTVKSNNCGENIFVFVEEFPLIGSHIHLYLLITVVEIGDLHVSASEQQTMVSSTFNSHNNPNVCSWAQVTL